MTASGTSATSRLFSLGMRIRFDGTAADQHRLFVVAFERVGNHIEAFKEAPIGMKGGQVAGTFQPLQGDRRFADITIGRSTQRPYEGEVWIEPQRAIKMADCDIEVFSPRTCVRIDAKGFRIVGIYFDGLEGQSLRNRQGSGDILCPTLTYAGNVP